MLRRVRPSEDQAIAALRRMAATLGTRLPCEVATLFGTALQWAECDPLNNSLVPGFVPLEYSFSTWHPNEFRVAAQLFAALDAPGRRAKTITMVMRLAHHYLTAFPALYNVDCALS